MNNHCSPDKETSGQKRSVDWMIAIALPLIALSYGAHYLLIGLGLQIAYLSQFAAAIVALVHRMWWGVAIGVVAVGVVSRLPQQVITALLTGKSRLGGIMRAAAGGVLLDLCSHGILLIGMQLYKRGASLGQTMAFLIASPWNSLSFTIILIALIGLPWTLVMIGASLLIAIVSGMIFEALVASNALPANPYTANTNDDDAGTAHTGSGANGYRLRDLFRKEYFQFASLQSFIKDSWSESRMTIRWIALGLLIAAAVRTAIPITQFAALFGPTIAGIGLTLLVATVLEICSEGSAPFAADIVNHAAAPGNGLAFLMAGVSTDYTELAAIKQTSGRWRVALALPVVTLPQIIALALLLNAV